MILLAWEIDRLAIDYSEPSTSHEPSDARKSQPVTLEMHLSNTNGYCFMLFSQKSSISWWFFAILHVHETSVTSFKAQQSKTMIIKENEYAYYLKIS